MVKKLRNEHVLELLLQRLMEPAFMPKGKENVVFDVPVDYMAPEYQHCAEQLLAKYSVNECVHVKINKVHPHPSVIFEFAKSLGRQDQYSDFLPAHRDLKSRVAQIFCDTMNLGDLVSYAVYARDNLNSSLFANAFSTALLHRKNLKGLKLPSVSSANPFKFFGGDVMSKATQQASVMGEFMVPIEAEVTASNLDPEHRLAYFREDLGVNSHHWKWHLVYPNNEPYVEKDRRGELFYYMHQQMIARYNAERLSNHLGKVKRFNDFREPIPEAYFPKLAVSVSMKNYPSRHANSVLKDINRKAENFIFDISMLDIWRSRIYEAIDTGMVKKKDGSFEKLTEETGIDILGNLLESSTLSVNRSYYGNLHSYGHIACGVIHDPDNAHLESMSVMGDVATACRDPFFYRWHAMVDDLCQSYKKTLPPYTEDKLACDGITIKKVEMVKKGGQNMNSTFSTFWRKDYIDIANGLDFQAGNKSLYVGVKHLQYETFDYRITVGNTEQRYGTVRIFIAPKRDDDGNTMKFNEQRTSFIELDKFIQYFQKGNNVIERSSCRSSVTIFQDEMFQTCKDPPKMLAPLNLTKEQEAENFCGCGWPNHMLLPKGHCDGMEFDLFVMISNFEDDNVGQHKEEVKCGAPSFCGIHDKIYPDKRAMGFPFDRDIAPPTIKAQPIKGVREFAKDYSNMWTDKVIIKFEDKTYEDPEVKKKIEKLKCLAVPAFNSPPVPESAPQPILADSAEAFSNPENIYYFPSPAF